MRVWPSSDQHVQIACPILFKYTESCVRWLTQFSAFSHPSDLSEAQDLSEWYHNVHLSSVSGTLESNRFIDIQYAMDAYFHGFRQSVKRIYLLRLRKSLPSVVLGCLAWTVFTPYQISSPSLKSVQENEADMFCFFNELVPPSQRQNS